MLKRFSRYSFVVTILWLGFVLAISFMEAPLKFQAPSLTLSVGLDVGRLIFWALNKVELFFMLLIIFAFAGAANKKKQAIPILLLVIILLIQTFWLLPALTDRAMSYINGITPESSVIHIYYIILEVLKVIILTILTTFQIKGFKLSNI